MLIAIGLLTTVLGFLIALASLGATSSPGARLAMVLAGIAISLYGMIGLLNRHYLRNAIWRR